MSARVRARLRRRKAQERAGILRCSGYVSSNTLRQATGPCVGFLARNGMFALLLTAGACGSITVPTADSGVDSAVGNDAASTDVVGNDAVGNDAPGNDAAPDTSAMTDGGGCVVQAAPDLPDDTFM